MNSRTQNRRLKQPRLLGPAALVVMLAGCSLAAPPHPGLLAASPVGKTAPGYYLTHLDGLRAKGVNQVYNPFVKNVGRESLAQAAALAGELRLLAVLVEFTDHPASVGESFFDSLVFGTQGATVSSYYGEISYGQLDLVTLHLPSSVGWVTAPNTYAYYVDGKSGTGDYPRNTQKLVEDIVDMIDAAVDFAQYDNDGDGFVDNLMVVHSGPGAEFSGGDDDIWSHKYAIAPREKDNVYISTYTIQPEYWTEPGDMTVGIYAHELGHVFGLPDLYDTDYSSRGIGRWGLMSYGSWNGPSGMGESPAHPCAWSRAVMGFVVPSEITASRYEAAMSDVETGGPVFRLPTAVPGNQYFLVENRQRVGFDAHLPGSGLLIWHVDESYEDNQYEWWPEAAGSNHYAVALEQADGLYELERNMDYGDAGDCFPGTTANNAFTAHSRPSSDTYASIATGVAVDNIAMAGHTMYADLVVDSSAISTGLDDNLPFTLTLSQNYPNPFNPATIIEFSLEYASEVRLEVFNTLGRLVTVIIDDTRGPGLTRVAWDGCDQAGRDVASGVYYYSVTAGDKRQVKKMMLVR
ncbi:MAG: M6 family metalloprotease domain-containing protein [candidate division Zixibacteria bacterium]|nr:M6 family metalloprotease domain-containing protein [candidate division Zixibacteria bacterium]